VTASQDGSVYLWHVKKTKPVFKTAVAHSKGWISALDNIKQSNVFATAGIDHVVKIWGIEGDAKGMNLLKEI
jgi:WD40 repeat protein